MALSCSLNAIKPLCLFRSTASSTLGLIGRCSSINVSRPALIGASSLLSRDDCLNIQIRHTSFFTKYSGDELWKGVTSVSNQGRQKGRASRVKRKIDFNRGQIIGRGKIQVNLPGLNDTVFNKQGISQIEKVEGKDELRDQRMKEARERQLRSKFKRRIDPLDRGWTSNKLPGRFIGPPDPVYGETFEGFDTIVLESKRVHHMTAKGRLQRYSVFVATGNKNGTFGFGLGKSVKLQDATKIARNRAGKHLLYIERFDNHTIFHDFWSQFYSTKIHVSKKPEGHGLICHRCIDAICKVIGIKNLYAKTEGAVKNYQNLTKAFILGLLRQKTHQQLADEKQLYLVERKEQNYDYPEVVATPKDGYIRKEEEIPNDEQLDFNLYTMNEKVALKRTERLPSYMFTYSYDIHLKKMKSLRNRRKTTLELMADWGTPQDFYTGPYKDYIPELPEK